MHYCITTKYLGPTNTKGARVVARSVKGKRVVPYDSALSARENHHAAAAELAYVNDWLTYADTATAQLDGATLPTEDGYAFLIPMRREE
jgi:hypothetical protein